MAVSSTTPCMTQTLLKTNYRNVSLCFKNTTNIYNYSYVANNIIARTKRGSKVVLIKSSDSDENDTSKVVLIKTSDSDENDTTSSTSSSTTEMEDEIERAAQVPKGPSSLISALNVEKALRGIAITNADHYGRLGLRLGCSYDQVRVAYQNSVNQLSSQELDEEELNKKRELLKESYTILSSEEERRLYDWSLARNENPERYVWPFEVDITQTPKGTPPPREAEDVGPTILVGYFFLGWLVLAFTLSIALNR